MSTLEGIGFFALLFFFLLGVATFGTFAWVGFKKLKKDIEAGQHDIERGLAQ